MHMFSESTCSRLEKLEHKGDATGAVFAGMLKSQFKLVGISWDDFLKCLLSTCLRIVDVHCNFVLRNLPNKTLLEPDRSKLLNVTAQTRCWLKTGPKQVKTDTTDQNGRFFVFC